MGRLITLSELRSVSNRSSVIDPTWYIEDTRLDYDSSKYVFNWPSISFPHKVAIHHDDLELNSNKIAIRRWIEINLHETVVCEIIDKSYRTYYTSDNWYQVKNLWRVFYFEDRDDATMFRLRFSNLVKEMTDKHPAHAE